MTATTMTEPTDPAALPSATGVETDDVAETASWLNDTAEGMFSRDPRYHLKLRRAADLLNRLDARVQEAERERDEARTEPTDDDVKLAIAKLCKLTTPETTNTTTHALNVIRRLVAATAHAKELAHYANGTADLAMQHRDTAERRLETARADALEEAARLCDGWLVPISTKTDFAHNEALHHAARHIRDLKAAALQPQDAPAKR